MRSAGESAIATRKVLLGLSGTRERVGVLGLGQRLVVVLSLVSVGVWASEFSTDCTGLAGCLQAVRDHPRAQSTVSSRWSIGVASRCGPFPFGRDPEADRLIQQSGIGGAPILPIQCSRTMAGPTPIQKFMLSTHPSSPMTTMALWLSVMISGACGVPQSRRDRPGVQHPDHSNK